jgi:hypothetical protein
MSRIVSTLLLSGALALGAVGSASAQFDPAKPGSPAPAATAHTGPLAAGPAAGIKQAQGAQRDRIWTYVPFAVVGGLALLVVLVTGDDDDDSTTTTTGTN